MGTDDKNSAMKMTLVTIVMVVIAVLVSSPKYLRVKNTGNHLFLYYKFSHAFLDENAPCVGICYYNKEKCFKDLECEDYDKGWPLNYKDFGPPCTGICHYLRENNMPNPGYEFQHTGIKPTANPVTSLPTTPSIDLTALCP